MKKITISAAAAVLALAGCASAAGPSAPATVTRPAATAPAVSPPAAVLATRVKASGLGVTHLIVYTPASDPNHLMGRQGGYTSKVAWTDPAAVRAGAGAPASDPGGTEFGGGIEVFPTTAGVQARYQELRGFKPPFGDGYDYLAGTAVLRLSQYLTPAQARHYERAFRSAVQS